MKRLYLLWHWWCDPKSLWLPMFRRDVCGNAIVGRHGPRRQALRARVKKFPAGFSATLGGGCSGPVPALPRAWAFRSKSGSYADQGLRTGWFEAK